MCWIFFSLSCLAGMAVFLLFFFARRDRIENYPMPGPRGGKIVLHIEGGWGKFLLFAVSFLLCLVTGTMTFLCFLFDLRDVMYGKPDVVYQQSLGSSQSFETGQSSFVCPGCLGEVVFPPDSPGLDTLIVSDNRK